MGALRVDLKMKDVRIVLNLVTLEAEFGHFLCCATRWLDVHLWGFSELEELQFGKKSANNERGTQIMVSWMLCHVVYSSSKVEVCLFPTICTFICIYKCMYSRCIHT